jgi:hypothetical protein
MIYGHFIEHFHRQIYGGIFDPGNPRTAAYKAGEAISLPPHSVNIIRFGADL